jgi:hypothetical protein
LKNIEERKEGRKEINRNRKKRTNERKKKDRRKKGTR